MIVSIHKYFEADHTVSPELEWVLDEVSRYPAPRCVFSLGAVELAALVHMKKHKPRVDVEFSGHIPIKRVFADAVPLFVPVGKSSPHVVEVVESYTLHMYRKPDEPVVARFGITLNGAHVRNFLTS